MALNNLATVLRVRGAYAEALALFSRALAIQRELFGDDSPSVATVLYNIGRLLLGLGRLDEAEDLLGEALDIRRTSRCGGS